MGWAVAEAARDRGANVTLVAGPVALGDPYGIRVLRVRSAAEMRDVIVPECRDADAVVMAAAVADYQAPDPSGSKLKRAGTEGLELSLVSTPDVLAEIERRPGLVRVGFAAESHDLVANARHKLAAKGLDLIAANDITATDAGFGSENNRVVLIDKKGKEELPLLPKYEVAWRILDRVSELVRGKA
jgi:phosphopantothenoylcysteine decarboxylase/phosphopantothenate--cysteine ligase